MSLLDSIVARLASLSDEEVRGAVVAAIFEKRTLGGIPGDREAQPEAPFAELLAAPTAQRRAAVLAGCRDVAARFYSALGALAPGAEAEALALADAASHFAALLGAGRLPGELAYSIRGLLPLALAPAVPAPLRDTLVSLVVAYAAVPPHEPSVWKDYVAGDVIPGPAFCALEAIAPRHPDRAAELASLWQRALRGALTLKMPFYVRGWARRQEDSRSAIRGVLTQVVEAAPDLREALRADCARFSFSRDWAAWMPEASEPVAPVAEQPEEETLVFPPLDLSHLFSHAPSVAAAPAFLGSRGQGLTHVIQPHLAAGESFRIGSATVLNWQNSGNILRQLSVLHRPEAVAGTDWEARIERLLLEAQELPHDLDLQRIFFSLSVSK
jgi:hypothetical protein